MREPEVRTRGAGLPGWVPWLVVVVVVASSWALAGPAVARSAGVGGGWSPSATAQVDEPGTPDDGPSLPDPSADPDEVRREAERILREGDFGRDEPEESETPPDELPDGDPGGSGGGETPRERPDAPQLPAFEGMGAIAKAIMWILVVAIVAVAAWLVWRALRDRRVTRRSEDDGDEVVVEDHPADAIDRPSDEWLAMAAEAEAAGRWREGLLYRYRSLVVALVDRGVVLPVAGRTVGEHRLDVAVGAPAAAEPFDEAAWLFERAWYGERPTGAQERDDFVTMADRVLAAPVAVVAAHAVEVAADAGTGAS